jgi:hypothetical protein
MSEESVRILVSVAAVVVSVFLAIAAFLQWVNARQTLALELFDRRIAYYRCVRRFIVDVVNRERSTTDLLLTFARDTDEARFFFGTDVRAYLDRLYFHALEGLAQHEQLYPEGGAAGLPVGPDRERASARYSHMVGWLGEQSLEVEAMLAPYLALGAATVPSWPGAQDRLRKQRRESWEVAKGEVRSS